MQGPSNVCSQQEAVRGTAGRRMNEQSILSASQSNEEALVADEHIKRIKLERMYATLD